MKKFFLLWFIGALLIAIPLARINLIRFYRLANEGVSTLGVVTALEPRKHQAVQYSYEVDGRSYSGIVNPRSGLFSIGQRVLVCYLPKDPFTSCVDNPNELLKFEEIPIMLAAVSFPPFVLFAWSWRYPRFGQWLSR